MVIRRERVVSAAPAEVWRVVSDPTRLAAWWPGVTRVEEASREAWKTVRADYSMVDAREPERVLWRHEVEESPFERLLSESTTEIALAAEATGGTVVTLTLDQRPRGWARFSPFQLRAAARRQAEGALEGLAELLGDEP